MTPEERDRFYELLDNPSPPLSARIYKMILSSVKDIHVVDDIYHDVLLTALKNFRDLKSEAKFGGWLMTITKHKILRYFRKIKSDKRKIDVVKESLSDPVDSPHARYLKTLLEGEPELAEKLGKFLETRTELEQECFKRHFFDGKKCVVVANELQISVQQVHRCIAKTKKALEKRKKEFICIIVALNGSEHCLAMGQEVYKEALDLTVEVSVGTAAAGVSAPIPAAATILITSFWQALFTLMSLFLWLFSVLIGGQYYGLFIVLNSSTLQMRRWLTHRLFLAYGLLAAIPLYFFFAGRIITLHILKWSNWTASANLQYILLLLIGILFIYRTRLQYLRFVNSQDTSKASLLSYRFLRGLIYGGFLALTIAFVYMMYSWWQIILSPALEYGRHRGPVGFIHMQYVVAGIWGGFILWFHVSSFLLFRYFLAISRDEGALERTPPPFDAEKGNQRAVLILKILLCGGGLLFVSFFNIMHLRFVQRRFVAPVLEIAITCLAWAYVLKREQQLGNPKDQLWLMLKVLITEIVVMYILRSRFYD